MVRIISRIGDTHALIFDDPLLKPARLKAGDEVNVEVRENGTITLTPLNSKGMQKEVSGVITQVMEDYATTMKKLA